MEAEPPTDSSTESSGKFSIDRKNELKRWSTYFGIDATMIELEESFITLVNDIHQRIYGLVQRTKEENKTKANGQLTAEDVEHLKENAEMNWKWLDSLAKTVQTHMSNASQYHMFHQTLLQFQLSIPRIGLEERQKLEVDPFEGNYEEANDIFHAIKIHLSEYISWGQKIELFITQSRTISPIGLRLTSTEIKRPSTMLVDYKMDKVILHRGEKVFVAENETKQRWNIENTRQERINAVPSICCEMSPPDLDVIESALLLRLELLANWTSSIKELGGVLMRYISTILGHWSIFDIYQCQHQGESKEDVYKSLFTMESLLNKYWENSPQLLYLQSKISALRAELEMRDTDDFVEDTAHINRNTIFIDISPRVLESHMENNLKSKCDTYILQKRSINILVNLYKELHQHWDNYRESMDNPSISCLIEDLKRGSSNTDEIVSRSSDMLMSCLSDNEEMVWSKYMRLLPEKSRSPRLDNPLIDMLPQTLDLRSKYNSKIEISYPAERELCFFKSNSLPSSSKSSPIDINQYFTSSLLPKPSKVTEGCRRPNPCMFRNSLQSETSSSASASREVSFDWNSKYSSMPRLQQRIEWDRDVYWQQNRIQPYFMVLNLPRADRILSVVDRRQHKSLSPSQARQEGLVDDNFLEFLDTDTNTKYQFQVAVTQGLVALESAATGPHLARTNSATFEIFTKAVFKVDGIFDPNTDEWINLMEAVDRNVLNCRSGQIKINKTDFCHVLSAMNMAYVRGRRLYNCNIKSLPPDMTIEIQKFP